MLSTFFFKKRRQNRLGTSSKRRPQATVETVEARMMLAGDFVAAADTPEASFANGVVLSNSNQLNSSPQTPTNIRASANGNAFVFNLQGDRTVTDDILETDDYQVNFGFEHITFSIADLRDLQAGSGAAWVQGFNNSQLPGTVSITIERLPLDAPQSSPTIAAQETAAIDLAQAIGGPARLRQTGFDTSANGIANAIAPSREPLTSPSVLPVSIEGAAGRARSLEVASTAIEPDRVSVAGALSARLEGDRLHVPNDSPRSTSESTVVTTAAKHDDGRDGTVDGRSTDDGSDSLASDEHVAAIDALFGILPADAANALASSDEANVASQASLDIDNDADPTLLSAALLELNRHWELTSLVLATGIISGYRYVEHPDETPRSSQIRRISGLKRSR